MIRVIVIVWLLICVMLCSLAYLQGTGGDAEYTVPPGYSTMPTPYYVSMPQQYGVDVLRGYFHQKQWSRDYEPDVFDCTEMSAFLEHWLENKGFHAYIVIGNYNSWHCWVRVEIAPSKYAIVEATTLTVITRDDIRYNKYRGIDRYETIYDALEVNQSAFDWWN